MSKQDGRRCGFIIFFEQGRGQFHTYHQSKKTDSSFIYRCLKAVTVNCNADSIFLLFSLFAGCIQWLPDITMLTQGPQRMCNCNDTKRHVSHQVT